MKRILALVLIAACGGGGSSPDAPIGDDDALADTPAESLYTPVTVDYVNPPAGSHAIFLTENDTVIADLDFSSGHVSQLITADGGSVNLFLPTAPTSTGDETAAIITINGVKIGEHIIAGQPATPSTQNVTVTVPVQGGATSYEVSSPCGRKTGASATLVVTLSNCGTQTDFHVRAFTTATTLGTFLVKQVAVASTINLTGTYVAPRTGTITLTNIPTAVTDVSLAYAIRPQQLWGLEPAPLFNGAPNANTATATGQMPDVGETEMLVQYQLTDPGHADPLHVTIAGATDFSETFDASTRLVPWPTSPTFVGATSTVSWTPAGAGTANVVQINLNTRTTDGTGSHYHARFIMSPAVGTSVHIPSLPAPYTRFNSIAGSPTMVLQVMLISAAAPDTVRSRSFDIVSQLPALGYVVSTSAM